MPRCALVVGCGLFCGSAAYSADFAGPRATPTADASTPIIGTPQNAGTAPKTAAATKEAPETWQQREERLQREQELQQHLEQLRTELNRPTAWQLQNPSGIQNHTPTEPSRGYTAPNTYFGPQQRAWSNLSAPVTMSQMPSNYFRVPPVNFSNVPLAPNTYWGPVNQNWSNVRTGIATPSSLGGWNYGPSY